jgi:transcriptional regulator with XRE-family HTH domain
VLTLGQRIRRAREARHQTQVQLAAEAGISQGYLSQLVQDQREPTLSIAARLAGALGVSLDKSATGAA